MPTGKWTATSTYDIYMVDTTCNNGGGNNNDGGGGDGDNNGNNNNNNAIRLISMKMPMS